MKTPYELGMECANAAIGAGCTMLDLIGWGDGDWMEGDYCWLKDQGVITRDAWHEAERGWNDVAALEAESIVNAHEDAEGSGAVWEAHERVGSAVKRECRRRGIEIVTD
jgi:hypothetical protein